MKNKIIKLFGQDRILKSQRTSTTLMARLRLLLLRVESHRHHGKPASRWDSGWGEGEGKRGLASPLCQTVIWMVSYGLFNPIRKRCLCFPSQRQTSNTPRSGLNFYFDLAQKSLLLINCYSP